MKKRIQLMSSVLFVGQILGLTAVADSFWSVDRPAGAVWSDVSNWSTGIPDTEDRANFVNTQATTYDVDVDTNAVFKKILVSQDYNFTGTGTIELQPASAAHWDKVIEVNQGGVSPVFNVDVMIHQTTDFVPRIAVYPSSVITFNETLTLTNSANASRQTDFNAAAATGSIVMNGDLYNHCGMRFGSSGLTTVIGGSGTTYGRTDSGAAILVAGRLELNRPQALINSVLKLEGTTVVLGADEAVASGANVEFRGGTVVAQGYDQTFGQLDVFSANVGIDMDRSDSIWTFDDSSAVAWDGGTLSISNAGNAIVRFEIGSGSGLTESQIGQINLNGSTLSLGDTTVSNGYLYVAKPYVATGDTFWKSDVASGAAWSDFGNWTAGRASTAGRANFVNDQSASYDVDVDMDAVIKKILVSTNYIFNGTGSVELQPASSSHWDPAIEVNRADASPVFNADVKVVGSTDYVMDIRNSGTLTFNGSLMLTNTAYSRPVNFNATGTTIINGDFYNYSGLRMGSSGTVIIGGDGTTYGTGPLTLGSGRVELNRAGAVLNSSILLSGTTVSLGAHDAIGTTADMTLNAGGLEAAGYNQDFGWLDISDNQISFDMDGSVSVWTFADSSSQGWGSGSIAITDVGNSVIRFELGSGTGLTSAQIGQIRIDGQTLTVGDTTVEDGYLYITAPAGPAVYYAGWAGSYGLSEPEADLLADPDGDGANNLLEYALGGNPTADDAASILPAFGIVNDGGVKRFEYRYLRRLDAVDRGLTYEALRDGSLLSGSWTNTGITETSGAEDAVYEAVTNSISMDVEGAQFMKLNVEFE
ncbi:hypothetical protein [Tichowtungia aerotolerans]|uniref:Autotransporter outer membrane beta-barrel domain-containing protein n=1 Tax=Tichowtungia aerotolerans TaxID=2697043 RepID=A0A6P1M8Y7_9BACT|nr:hypothetical protein [Tichowtungia aerotolerans]QHI70351.1 hypothetical protein GT409_13180 [Tichowtungia aerotolerans]